ncbi:MAG: Sec-independent protein translocase subunit TatB [Candidatus Schmidhempelia sp.]|nr:Sec-independent protein translocase subunit TatB [Candidatus Schmidhempelia sp.]
MFDISFSQLLLVMIIGLIVLGPQKLPIAIKTVASWIRTLRTITTSVQLELSKELQLQELQASLKKAEESGLKNIAPEIQASIDELKQLTTSIQESYTKQHHEITTTEKSTQHHDNLSVKNSIDTKYDERQ